MFHGTIPVRLGLHREVASGKFPHTSVEFDAVTAFSMPGASRIGAVASGYIPLDTAFHAVVMHYE